MAKATFGAKFLVQVAMYTRVLSNIQLKMGTTLYGANAHVSYKSQLSK